MKKLYITLFVCLAQLSLNAQTYSGGSGSMSDPFVISNKLDLKYLSENQSEWGLNFIQSADLNFTSSDFSASGQFYNAGSGFLPIGNATVNFTGNYDGGNFTIDGLNITSPGNYVGLFGYAFGSNLSNINLTNSVVSGTDYVGKLVAYFDGSIINCMANGNVTGNNIVGGLVGFYNSGTGIIGCSSTGDLNGLSNLGGLVGNNNSKIENSFAAGTVTGTIDPTSINIGGLVGLNSFNTEIRRSYSSASLYGNSHVGGLVGNINDNCIIANCYATGNLVGGYYIGGFIGRFVTGNLNVMNSYCLGNVSGVADKGSFGGNSVSGTYTNCYWNSETSGLATSGGGGAMAGVQSRTTLQMKTQSTYSGWDFIIETLNGSQDIWKMNACTNDGYPLLSWGIPLVVDDASFSFDQPSYCLYNMNPTPTITGLSGGTFSSSAGLVIDPSTGTISTASSNVGSYIVTYSTNTSCSGSTSVSIEMTVVDDVNFSYPSALCSNQNSISPIITGVTFGTFTAGAGLIINSSTGVIDATTSTPGNYNVEYYTSSGCSNNTSVNITISPVDVSTYNYAASTYCIAETDPTPTITGASGGLFSSTAGLVINTSTGQLDLSASTPNSYTVTYTTNGMCPSSSDVNVVVNGLDDVSYSYSEATVCANGGSISPTITGVTGGTFSSTAGLSINTTTGLIDPSSSTPNTYSITYATSGTCGNSEMTDVEILSLPSNVTTVAGSTITASQSGLTYKWIDCENNNSVIAGQTSQNFTPTSTGNYAVIVDNGSCVDTSSCVAINFVGIIEANSTDWRVYPNPTNGDISIEFEGGQAHVIITDATGKLMWKGDVKNHEMISLNNYSRGVYFVEFISGKTKNTKRIIKQS